MTRSRWVRPALLLGVVLAGVILARALGVTDYVHLQNLARLKDTIEASGVLGPLLYVAAYALGTVLFVPGLPMTLLGGLVFGPVWGTVYVWIAATLGAGLAFLVARYALRGVVEGWVRGHPRLATMDGAVAREGWRIVMITRLVPLFPFNLQNYAYGLTRIGFGTYLVTSALCMLPGSAAYTFAAGALSEGRGNLTRTLGYLAVAGALIVLVSLIPRVLRRRSRAAGELLKTAVVVPALGALLVAARLAAAPPEIPVGRFGPAGTDGLPAGWTALTFPTIPRHTRYTVIQEGGEHVLRAESRASASGLYTALDADPREYRILAWRWKVEGVLQAADATRRAGDDYPARVYVAFGLDRNASVWERVRAGAARLVGSRTVPQHALNYIWDNRLPIGTILENAYTGRARMIVVESGPAKAGQWVAEERDLYEDYRRAFGGEPPRIVGLALMTDTDDTGEHAIAYYADLVLRASR